MQIKEVLVGFITHYSRAYDIGYGKINKKRREQIMKCRLMNKHTQVALIEYNEDVQVITNIYEITNIEYAPLSFYNAILKSLDMDTIRDIPIQNLKELSEEYYAFLKKFQSEMKYKNKEWSDERLEKLKDGLSTRIDLFEKERGKILDCKDS